MSKIFVALFLSILIFSAQAEESGKSYFLIGNSLTWDTLPPSLDGDVQWHVDCEKNLLFIYRQPEHPCIQSSTPWPKALKDRQYDYVVVQPFYGTDLADDVTVISLWVEMQPHAIFVIHPGWAFHEKLAEEYAAKGSVKKMQHSPAYFDSLLAALREKFPGREFHQTLTIELLEKVSRDIATNKAPFKNVRDLYRDHIHMKFDSGRYLMHNAMRIALGQPKSIREFKYLDPQLRQYLDGVLYEVAR